MSLNLTLQISFSHINTWIVSFYPKNLFLSKFSSDFELFFRFTQITKVRFIDVIIPLRSISTNVSNCIVLNFMYTKFQVSSSKKWQSYWYSNMVHLLLITLYLLFMSFVVADWFQFSIHGLQKQHFLSCRSKGWSIISAPCLSINNFAIFWSWRPEILYTWNLKLYNLIH